MNEITSFVTTTASSPDLFTVETRRLGHNWHDLPLRRGRSDNFIHITGPTFVPYGNMWLAKYESLPKSTSEARNRFRLPLENPATHIHIFYFEIPMDYSGLKDPVVLMVSEEVKTQVWQAKIQDQIVPFIHLVETIHLK